MRYNQKERQEIIEGKTYFAAQARNRSGCL